MTVTATFRKQDLASAATSENLTGPQTKAALALAPDGWLPTLVNFANDPTSSGKGLAGWRSAFPAILNHADDVDSFLIRVAVQAAGGVAL